MDYGYFQQLNHISVLSSRWRQSFFVIEHHNSFGNVYMCLHNSGMWVLPTHHVYYRVCVVCCVLCVVCCVLCVVCCVLCVYSTMSDW